ncbi:type II toxin-antitoxin system VapC family toxin [Moorena sp. SIO3H5]|uniref:type II toxin-antitoxin system VapC family toxin n=1 Tax=Moorena sp. SIO3H5 TaxID=2607834 RepID=UPI0013BD7F49|nr:type II toxin-antitoxin system VapC family toxin [Moorena sp. SIO3H5]NEO69073.1 type II toxin-antitoxin system VapC family toxin [Moorena sp. SIO3H5]
MYLLDTNHCSFVLIQKDYRVIQKLESLMPDTELAINTIIYGELLTMADKSQRIQENLALIEDFVSRLKIYPIDQETSKIYGKFHAEIFANFAPQDKAKRRKFNIKDAGVRINDLWIACTAIQHNLIIVSEDRDYRKMNKVRNLKLECWK